ncbi:right-handed parallel beta-helix repeat-containing protein [bacterium]|nr:right-handed parallel beta-helix repeat-containing protein [bacterium]
MFVLPRVLRAAVGPALLSMVIAVPCAAGDLYPPAGAPAPTMKRLDEVSPSRCISSLPYSITESGRYEVCGNLTGTSGQNGITISASNVVLDLGGFTLTGGAGSLDAVNISSGGNVTVRGGTLTRWDGDGIDGASDTLGALYVHDVSVSSCKGNGISISSGGVYDSSVSSCARNGVSVGCPSGSCGGGAVYLEGVRSTGNGFSGISSSNGPELTLERCVSSGNASHGVYMFYDSTPARAQDYNSSRSNNSSSIDNGGDGWSVETVEGVSVALSFDGCVSSGNVGAGFRTVCEPLDDVSVSLLRCEADKNGQEGVRVSEAALRMDGGSSSRNGSHGIWISSSGSATKAQDYNSSRSNTTSAVDVGDNSGDGILLEVAEPFLDPGLDPFGVETLDLSSCRLVRNTGNGLRMSGNAVVSFDRCVVSENDGAGLSVSTTSYSSGLSKADSKRSFFSSNGGGGAVCPSASATVEWSFSETEFSRCGADGVQLAAGQNASDLRLSLDRCVVSRCDGDGVALNASYGGGPACPSSLLLSSSSLRDNGGVGASCVSETASVTSSRSSGNGGGGMVCGTTNHFVAGGSGFDGNTSPGLVVVSPVTVLNDVRCVGNGGDGADLTSDSSMISSCVFSDNDLRGIRSRTGGGRISSCVVSSNGDSGIVVEGSGMDVCENVVSGHQNAGATASGIDVVGTGNRVRGNMTSSNDRGVSLRSNGNPVYEGSSTGGENPLFEDAGVSGNSSGSTTIDAASNPFDLITH